MSIVQKTIEQRVCDFEHEERRIAAATCLFCGKDVCGEHGAGLLYLFKDALGYSLQPLESVCPDCQTERLMDLIFKGKELVKSKYNPPPREIRRTMP